MACLSDSPIGRQSGCRGWCTSVLVRLLLRHRHTCGSLQPQQHLHSSLERGNVAVLTPLLHQDQGFHGVREGQPQLTRPDNRVMRRETQLSS
jgi:hypothetical protein